MTFPRLYIIGLSALAVITASYITTDYVLSKKARKVEHLTIQDKEAKKFWQELDTVIYHKYKRERYSDYHYDYRDRKYERHTVWGNNLHEFDLNKIDSAGLVSMGLLPWQAKSIVRYRDKCGRFENTDVLKRLNSLDKDQCNKLMSYAKIFRKPTEDTNTRIETAEIINIDINSADTKTIYQDLNISPKIAEAIVRYRERLGGYMSKEQIYDALYWMHDKKKVDEIVSHININNTQIHKLKINKLGINALKRHPYIRFYEARAIYELRKTRGRLNSIEDLRNTGDEYLNDNFLHRIGPYLSYE